MSKRDLGVIDTLSAGLNTVAQAWWIIAIPVTLDLLYWLGPKVSIAPVVYSLLATFPTTSELGADQQGLALLRQSLEQIAESLNLLTLLSAQLLGMPGLLISGRTADSSASFSVPVVEVSGLPAFVLVSLTLTFVGLLVGCLYLALIARRVQNEKLAFDVTFWRRVGAYWGRVVLLSLLVMAALIAVNLPIMLAGTVIAFFSRFLAAVLGVIWSVTVFWTLIFLFFTVDAIVINDVGPLRAAWNSFNVVRHNFWSAIGLILLINILTVGLTIIWRRLTISSLGAFVGIVGNAFVGTSLVAAALIFYRDRYLKWQEVQRGGYDSRAIGREA